MSEALNTAVKSMDADSDEEAGNATLTFFTDEVAKKHAEYDWYVHDKEGHEPTRFFFWRDLFLLTLTHYISKARRLPDKAAALTSVGRVLIGAVPQTRVGSRLL